MYVFHEFCLAAIFTPYTALISKVHCVYHRLNEAFPLLLFEELRQSADEMEFFDTDRDAIASNPSNGSNQNRAACLFITVTVFLPFIVFFLFSVCRSKCFHRRIIDTVHAWSFLGKCEQPDLRLNIDQWRVLMHLFPLWCQASFGRKHWSGISATMRVLA